MAFKEKVTTQLEFIWFLFGKGPLDTAMVEDVMTSSSTNVNIRHSFESMKSKGQLLSPDESAKKLVKILKLNSFKNGDHVDFFDVE